MMSKRICPNCGRELREQESFCMKCGTKYVEKKKDEEEHGDLEEYRVCPKCGHLLKHDQKFCMKCGTRYEVKSGDSHKEEEEKKNDAPKEKKEEKKILVCEKCGNTLKEGQKFCMKCGARVEKEEKEEKTEEPQEEKKEIRVCRNCGAVLGEKDSFCFECGSKYQSKEELEKEFKQEETKKEETPVRTGEESEKKEKNPPEPKKELDVKPVSHIEEKNVVSDMKEISKHVKQENAEKEKEKAEQEETDKEEIQEILSEPKEDYLENNLENLEKIVEEEKENQELDTDTEEVEIETEEEDLEEEIGGRTVSLQEIISGTKDDADADFSLEEEELEEEKEESEEEDLENAVSLEDIISGGEEESPKEEIETQEEDLEETENIASDTEEEKNREKEEEKVTSKEVEKEDKKEKENKEEKIQEKPREEEKIVTPVIQEDAFKSTGHEDTLTCPNCHSPVDKEDKVCPLCGEQLKKPKKTVLLILLILLLLLFLAGGTLVAYKKGWLSFLKETPQEEVVTKMPNVVGKSYEEAKQALKGLGLEIIVEQVQRENKEPLSQVFYQSIEKDAVLKGGEQVILRIYVKREVSMISVEGLTKQEAEQRLEVLGLEVTWKENYSETVEKDVVISQEVKEGERLIEGDTVVLTVSLGKEEDEDNPSENSNDTTNSNTPTTSGTAASSSSNNGGNNSSWSNWTTSLPTGVNSSQYDIESRVEYHFQTKQTTTSTTTNSLVGWTLVNEVRSKDDTSTIVTREDDYLKNYKNNPKVISAKANGDIYLVAKHCDKTTNGAKDSVKVNSNLTCPAGYVLHTSITMYGERNKYNVGDVYPGKSVCDVTGKSITDVVTYKENMYTVVIQNAAVTYYFEKWSNWSNWSVTKATANDNTRVETRTVYRYKKK